VEGGGRDGDYQVVVFSIGLYEALWGQWYNFFPYRTV